MKPTLQCRLKNAPTSELEALEQLAQSVELTPYAKKRLERLNKKQSLKNQMVS